MLAAVERARIGALALLAAAACQGPAGESSAIAKRASLRRAMEQARREASPRFGFSHELSVLEGWPFGLDDCTTKIVVEPAKAEDIVESYWVVRASSRGQPASHDGAITAVVRVSAEFPGGDFEAVRGRDYDLVTGTDRNGATTVEREPGLLEIRVPASDGSQSGFAVRARFFGDTDGQEPPRSLLIDVVRVVDEPTGSELELGPVRRARWLIVDPDGGR
jgi:hypothetical protein